MKTTTKLRTRNRTRTEVEDRVEEKPQVEFPSITMKDVVILNDDYTPFHFVIAILRNLFTKTPVEAAELTAWIHRHGEGVAGQYMEAIAQEKAQRVRATAQAAGFPLQAKVR